MHLMRRMMQSSIACTVCAEDSKKEKTHKISLVTSTNNTKVALSGFFFVQFYPFHSVEMKEKYNVFELFKMVPRSGNGCNI